jgi:hypothetical protein
MIPTDKTSVSNLFVPIQVDNMDILDFWTSWQLSTDILKSIKGEGEILVDDDDSWHSISEQLYGTREYWWVLAIFNNVDDPFSLFFDSSTTISKKRINVIRLEEITTITREVRRIRLKKEVQNVITTES